MYAYIKGSLCDISPTEAVIEAGGIGYRILIPVNLHNELPTLGAELKLHLSLVIRENSQTLFGFVSSEEKMVFEVLLNVSGIGPKTALAIIGHLPGATLYEAVEQKDVRTICKVPGIGKKTAERLLIEIRDKLPALFPSTTGQESLAAGPTKMRDAMAALINLGYTQSVAQRALTQALERHGEEAELGILITASLQNT